MTTNGRAHQQTRQDWWDRIWRNNRGEIVIWQRPNIPLIAWVVLTLLAIIFTGTFASICWYAAAACLAIWALLEILKGVNYFRRALGVIVLLLIISAIFKVGY